MESLRIQIFHTITRNLNGVSCVGSLYNRVRTAHGRWVENRELLASFAVPELGASRQRGRLRSVGRWLGLRAGVVHPIGHYNGGKTVSGQRYRAHDTVSRHAGAR